MNRRSEKLDALLDKKVQIKFVDGTYASGVLAWNELFSARTPYHSNVYLLHREHFGTVEFRKTHVADIKEI